MSERSYHDTTLTWPENTAHVVHQVREELAAVETANPPVHHELVVTTGTRHRVLWAMEMRPVQDRATGESGFMAIESYYPRDTQRDNTWIYHDVKPGQAPVERAYWLDTDRKPGRLAGFVGSRFAQVIEHIQAQALTHRVGRDVLRAAIHPMEPGD